MLKIFIIEKDNDDEHDEEIPKNYDDKDDLDAMRKIDTSKG